ncbi:MAG: AAA family ATPase [Sulfurovum sp.]|nr:AAA family ATPase [Sulfurovum sp.]
MLNLALKHRPKTLDAIIGQSHLLSRDAVFRTLIETNRLSHTFFYGASGTGKTTLARVIASVLKRPFYEMNATSLKIEDVRKILKNYTHALEKPVLFIDEVHRLSKTQQEVLLPFMENHTALIIGASTENPYFSLTMGIRSRAHLFELHPISSAIMTEYIEEILQKENIHIEDDAKEYLCFSSAGDVRAMLNLLESASAVCSVISLFILKQIRPQAIQAGASQSQSHYDLMSALIKNIRASHMDESLYTLAKLIEGGEPAGFIARRLAIFASEDIGNANPPALNLASSTLNIVQYIGYPEARISLSQLVIYLVSSPKSRSAYSAIYTAVDVLKEGGNSAQPLYQSQEIGFEKTLAQWHRKIKGEG